MIWKNKAGKKLPVVGGQGADRAAGPHAEKPVTGFKGRSGRSLPGASWRSSRPTTGKWRVEFDEPWAREGAKPPEGEEAETPATEAAALVEAAQPAPPDLGPVPGSLRAGRWPAGGR